MQTHMYVKNSKERFVLSNDFVTMKNAGCQMVAKKIATAVKEAYGCDGINILQNNGEAAGQTVFHLHVHIVPRFKGDDVTICWKPGETPTDMETIAEEIKSKL